MVVALLKFVLIVAITMALSITLMMKGIGQEDEGTSSVNPSSLSHNNKEESLMMINYQNPVGSKRKSRFLAGQERNPRAADHCHKEHEVCYYDEYAKNSTCCNNKCVDLSTDDKNCGACKKKCKYTETCCRGQCVNLSYDKRHCGYCNRRCDTGELCVYGLCNYP